MDRYIGLDAHLRREHTCQEEALGSAEKGDDVEPVQR